jgi:DNA-binding NarL/FixJ family response regulator
VDRCLTRARDARNQGGVSSIYEGELVRENRFAPKDSGGEPGARLPWQPAQRQTTWGSRVAGLSADKPERGQRLEKAVNSDNRIRIALYTQQPFVAQGLAAVFCAHADLELAACRDSLSGTLDCLRSSRPDVLLVHLLAGISLSELHQIRSADSRCHNVLWGQELEGEFAFQAIRLGVRGILPGNISIDDFLAALRHVHQGALCFGKDLLESVLSQKRAAVALTQRQGQIVSLVAQGFKNKEIAFSLGITEGTVKVYLYKLFHKLGINDRLAMALYGRRNLFSGQLGLERMRDAGPPVALPSLFLMAKEPADHRRCSNVRQGAPQAHRRSDRKPADVLEKPQPIRADDNPCRTEKRLPVAEPIRRGRPLPALAAQTGETLCSQG